MKILLPVDQSTFSQEAIRMVASQVRPKGNQVRVLHVIEHTTAYLSADLYPYFVRQTALMDRDIEAEAKALVHRAVAKLRRAGIKTSGVIVKGNANRIILNQAGKWRADLIVMGSHGLRGLKRLLMGSVSTGILRNAKCSVQVVRSRGSRGAARRKVQSKRRK
jgi:nucleotide-binding universal stress UspA family protein